MASNYDVHSRPEIGNLQMTQSHIILLLSLTVL